MTKPGAFYMCVKDVMSDDGAEVHIKEGQLCVVVNLKETFVEVVGTINEYGCTCTLEEFQDHFEHEPDGSKLLAD